MGVHFALYRPNNAPKVFSNDQFQFGRKKYNIKTEKYVQEADKTIRTPCDLVIYCSMLATL